MASFVNLSVQAIVHFELLLTLAPHRGPSRPSSRRIVRLLVVVEVV